MEEEKRNGKCTQKSHAPRATTAIKEKKNKPLLLAKQPNGEMHIVTKGNNNPRGAGCQTGFHQQQIRINTVPFGWCKQLVLTEVVAAIITGCTSHPVNVNKEKSPLHFFLVGVGLCGAQEQITAAGQHFSLSSILARANT